MGTFNDLDKYIERGKDRLDEEMESLKRESNV
jgi:hypothetical protein